MRAVEEIGDTCPRCERPIEGFAYPGRVGEAMDWVCGDCAFDVVCLP
jgi:hypothetical protein